VALAAAVACFGLYGLATPCRVQEIGICKGLAASTRDVLRLLIGPFLRLVPLANLIACSLA
jgi:putative ABC transport system permease protein